MALPRPLHTRVRAIRSAAHSDTTGAGRSPCPCLTASTVVLVPAHLGRGSCTRPSFGRCRLEQHHIEHWGSLESFVTNSAHQCLALPRKTKINDWFLGSLQPSRMRFWTRDICVCSQIDAFDWTVSMSRHKERRTLRFCTRLSFRIAGNSFHNTVVPQKN